MGEGEGGTVETREETLPPVEPSAYPDTVFGLVLADRDYWRSKVGELRVAIEAARATLNAALDFPWSDESVTKDEP